MTDRVIREARRTLVLGADGSRWIFSRGADGRIHADRIRGHSPTVRLSDLVARPSGAALEFEHRAPTASVVREIHVEVGSRVEVGDTLVRLESMKMALLVRAARRGVVASLDVRVGEQVTRGALLVRLDDV